MKKINVWWNKFNENYGFHLYIAKLIFWILLLPTFYILYIGIQEMFNPYFISSIGFIWGTGWALVLIGLFSRILPLY